MFLKLYFIFNLIIALNASHFIKEQQYDQKTDPICFINLASTHAEFHVSTQTHSEKITVVSKSNCTAAKNFKLHRRNDILYITSSLSRKSSKKLSTDILITVPKSANLLYIILSKSQVRFDSIITPKLSIIAQNDSYISLMNIHSDHLSVHLENAARLVIDKGHIKKLSVHLQGQAHHKVNCEVDILSLISNNKGSVTFYDKVHAIKNICLNYGGSTYFHYIPDNKGDIFINHDKGGHVTFNQEIKEDDALPVKRARL